MNKNYEYLNPICSIQLVLVEKTIKEKAIPYLKLGNYQVLTISWYFFWYELLFEEIKLNKNFGDCSLTIL